MKEIPELISFGKTELTREKFIHPLSDWVKPIGGIWASTYDPTSIDASDWERWCKEEKFSYNDQEAVIFTLQPKSKIYEIDNVRDLVNIVEKYPYDGGIGTKRWIDFQRAACDYDAIHLTEFGQCQTRMSSPYDLYGWDVESYLILNFEAIDKQRAARRQNV